MTTLEYAKRELELQGYFDPDDGGMNRMMADNVLDLIRVFSEQGHSGFSASFCIRLFERLASYKPLGPLTGEDDEWMEVGTGQWQNKRWYSVFKDKDHAYNIEGKIFRDKDGCCYTNSESWVDISFPYTVGEPEVVDVV